MWSGWGVRGLAKDRWLPGWGWKAYFCRKVLLAFGLLEPPQGAGQTTAFSPFLKHFFLGFTTLLSEASSPRRVLVVCGVSGRLQWTLLSVLPGRHVSSLRGAGGGLGARPVAL